MQMKDGVQWRDMHPSMWYARWVSELCCRKKAGRGVIITSARDGTHSSPQSLHYVGRAFDQRTRDLTDEQIQALAAELRDWLGPDYDVVIERTHIHLEYDPKGYTDQPDRSPAHSIRAGSEGSGRSPSARLRQPPAKPRTDSGTV